ncbi:MAG: DUF4159 domain-containing protein [Alphaproteobacteria bacterium]|nr:DUF4159 domain-containing protein [Alphaproteobacteria bacterium]
MTFLSPLVLGALAAVPVLWWMLRVMPPRPKTVRFPAFFLLKDLSTNLKAAAYTPWWLLLLRALIVILFIIGFAEPVLHQSQNLPGGTKGEVLLVIDNGWASASGWKARQDKLKEYLQLVRRSGRPVIFLPTAPSGEDGHVRSIGPMAAEEAEAWVDRQKPQPWPVADKEAADVAQKILSGGRVSYAVFFSDGLAAAPELLNQVQTVVTDDTVNNPYILRQDSQKPGQSGFSLERLHAALQGQPLQILAYADDGSVVDELKLDFPAGKTEYAFSWEMLPELRNKTARLALREPVMASASLMTDAQWRQHPVGVVANAGQKEGRDFLNEVYYLRRALEANNQMSVDQLDALLKMPLSALILPDSTPLTAAEKVELLDWVQQGGFLIRFAGPNLAANTGGDALLPVPLRYGQRAMEGALTWEKPVALGDISEQSPLYGLTVPHDVMVSRQVLADPVPEVFEKTWLQLEDGTPLVTGGKMGKGTVVLVHTSAGPEWSNFCYSGLYVEALQRMISLSNGISDYRVQTALPPLLLLDGFGIPGTPDSRTMAAAVTADQEFEPLPQTPPGLYGDSREFKAFNLGAYLPRMTALKGIPESAAVETYSKAEEVNLKPAFIKGALLLLLLETLVTFWLRGVVAFAAVLLATMIFSSAPAVAAEDEKDLVSGIYLAYIETGDQDIDSVSYHGLTGLGQVITARTTARIKGVVALNPDSDPLAYYPVIYWPMSERQLGLSVTAARNIQNYLSQGGMILIDTRDRQFGDGEGSSTLGARKLRELTQNIQIPELMSIPKDHILTRSFYLLDDFPGRYVGGKLWVEKEPSPRHDSVTSVIIGSNDWAAAWSKDEGDRNLFMVEPGGETQREMAYRFGINLVMVALTGNYKADQVHIPYILERIGQ